MAIWYINPTIAPGDESDAFDGGYGSGKLRDAFADVSGLSAGDAIYFKSGATHSGRCTLTTGGTAAAYITVGKYGGAARAVIDAEGGTNGTAAFLVNGVSYVRVSGLHGINHTASAGSAICALRSSYVEITDCEGSGCMAGIRVAQDQGATVSNIRVSECYVHDNTYMGIYVHCGGVASAVIGDVDIEDNLVERNGFASGGSALARGGIFVRSLYTTTVDATRAPYGIRTRRNTVRGNSGYGIAYSPVVQGDNKIAENEVTGQTPNLDDDTHCIWVGGASGVEIRGNHIHHNFGYLDQSSGSGVGVFVDQYFDGYPSSHCLVIGNRIHDQWNGNSSAQFASSGVYFFHATDSVASGNKVYRCRNGISVRGDSSNNTEGIGVYNNTCVDIEEVAFGAAYKADGITYRNNLAVEAATGFFAETGANAVLNVDRDYGIAYDCAEPWAVGTLTAQTAGSAGSNDSEDDPLLDASYRPRAGSPVLEAGTKVAGVRLRDFYGKEIDKTPDIGAVQVYPARAVSATRAAMSRSAADRSPSVRRAAYG